MNHSMVFTTAAVVVLLAGLAPLANSSCTNPNGVLNAPYGWQGEGLLATGNSNNPKIGDFVPLVQVGVLIFDGTGHISGFHNTSLGGTLVSHADSGAYSVNSDCITGTISLANGFTMSVVITNGGEEIKFVSATTGGVTSGAHRLVASGPCSASTLSGNSYGYSSHGLVAAGNGDNHPRIGGYVPFADAGQISFAADGSVAGSDNENLGGVVMPGQPIAGYYTVNSDCTGTTTMTIAGVEQSWDFVILQGADRIIFISTAPGYVWAGTLTGD